MDHRTRILDLAGAAPLGLFLLAWLLIDPFGNFPLNDDWSYALAVKSILQTGRFTLTAFSAPNTIVQAWWGALFCVPFGLSYDALRLSTLVLALAGLLATYGLLRELGAARLTAGVAALTLGVNPVFLQLSASFMTDVPFTALSTVALWLFVRGLCRDQPGTVLAAYVAAALALFIRQFALALPAAFAVALILRHGPRHRVLAAAVLPVLAFAAAHLLFQHWMVATGRIPAFAESLGALAGSSLAAQLPAVGAAFLSMLPYFGLFCLPFLAHLAVHRPQQGAYFWPASVLLGAALAAFLFRHGDALPEFGNALRSFGLGPIPLYDVVFRRTNVPVVPGSGVFWACLTVAGTWADAVLLLLVGRSVGAIAGAFGRREWPRDQWQAALMIAYVAAIAAATILAAFVSLPFDRYLLCTITPLCALLFVSLPNTAARPRPVALAAGLAPLALCALFGILAAHDYFALARTRWAATDWLESQGVPPTAIDGGFEYNGEKTFDPHYQRDPAKSWWWVKDNRYLVALGPYPGYTAIRTLRFPHWLPATPYDVQVLQRND